MEELAKLAGTSKSMIRGLEQKPIIGRPNAERISKIAEALGATTEFLLVDDPEFTGGEDAVFIMRYRRAGAETRRKLAAILAVLET